MCVCVCLFKLCFWDGLLFGGFGFCLLEKEGELVKSSEQGISGSCCVGDLWTVVSELCVCWSLVGFGLILDACGTFDRWQVPGHDDEGADYVCRSESVNPGPWGGDQVIESQCEGICDCCIGTWHGLAR